VTWGFLYVLGMYPECILMCPVHIHHDTSIYIKIHLYLSLWPHRFNESL
jgi:hypothetical protein